MKQLVVCQFYLQFTGGNSNFLSWLTWSESIGSYSHCNINTSI